LSSFKVLSFDVGYGSGAELEQSCSCYWSWSYCCSQQALVKEVVLEREQSWCARASDDDNAATSIRAFFFPARIRSKELRASFLGFLFFIFYFLFIYLIYLPHRI
jgi:hypothetical protein